MKELLEPVLKQLPTYLPDLGSLVTGPKTAILAWIDEAKGELPRPFIFVAVTVAFGFLLQLPQMTKDDDFTTLVAGMAVFKVLALVLFAAIIHVLFHAVRGHARFVETLSAYLYAVSPLYLVLVILEIGTLGVLRAYDPEVAAASQMDPQFVYADAARWRAFSNAAPGLALTYMALNVAKITVAVGWIIACWGAFRRLHGVARWQSALAAIGTLAGAFMFFFAMEYIMLGMFNTRMPVLR